MTSFESSNYEKERLTGLRRTLHEIIFESDTAAGKAFDVALIAAIVLSVVVVMLESVARFRLAHGEALRVVEWAFTIIFTIEYVLRLATVARPMRYARSFFGVVDLLAVVPTYVSFLVPGAQYLLVVRVLRILRIFRVLKLAHYLSEAEVLMRAMRASGRKIVVFTFAVLTLVILLGSLMYLVEGPEHGFTSIPISVYWAIVTLTTVGYGDISPQTELGQALASVIMIMGYGIIAVPTGIVTSEITRADRADRVDRAQRSAVPRDCPSCGLSRHDLDAVYCKQCGATLPPPAAPAVVVPAADV